MKTIIKYMLMAAVVLMTTACEKDSLLSQYEGGVKFDIKMTAGSRTTSTESSTFIPEQIRVRIYREDGALIRRYIKLTDVPSPLYLVAGSYSVKVDAGDQANVAFKEPATVDERKQMLCYAGAQTFTVTANQTATEPIAVNCPTVNLQVTVGFDKTDSATDGLNSLYENRYLKNVQIKVAAISADGVTNFETFSAKVDEAEAPNLLFTYEDDDANGGSQSGYFLMPEGVTTLVWAFKATHDTENPDIESDGAIDKVGVLSTSVEAGKNYKVNFKYARTPDGAGGINVTIDESVVTFDDSYSFKPQPEITGEGFDVAVANAYKDQDVVLYCESIYNLHTLSLNNTPFFVEGAVSGSHGINGLTCEKESETKVKITLSSEYFTSFPSGAINLNFDMQDKDGEKVSETYPQKVVLMKQGFMEYANPNLWTNTIDLSAVVTDETVSSVGFKIRKKGTNEWSDVFTASEPAESGNGFRIFKASTVASWIESENPNGHTIYTPNVSKSIFAGNTYEIQTLIGGSDYGSPIEYTAPTSTQTIPYATFEDSSLSCFGTDNSKAVYWGSGNNTFTKGLCTQSTRTGMGGEKCALLTSSATLGMLASGNLFTGQFLFNLSSQEGTVKFGIDYDWQHRPSAMTVKCWRDIKDVTSTKFATNIEEGAPDQASIYVCIVDWDSQHSVTSGSSAPTGVWSPENGPDASASSGKVVGYGVIYPQGTTSGESMETITIPIHYYDKVTKPSKKYKLIISAATSRYGDYMNGAEGSTMYLDDFQWVY